MRHSPRQSCCTSLSTWLCITYNRPAPCNSVNVHRKMQLQPPCWKIAKQHHHIPLESPLILNNYSVPMCTFYIQKQDDLHQSFNPEMHTEPFTATASCVAHRFLCRLSPADCLPCAHVSHKCYGLCMHPYQQPLACNTNQMSWQETRMQSSGKWTRIPITLHYKL